MELFILISCVLLLVLNIILIGLHVRSRKNNTVTGGITVHLGPRKSDSGRIPL